MNHSMDCSSDYLLFVRCASVKNLRILEPIYDVKTHHKGFQDLYVYVKFHLRTLIL